MSEFDLDRLLSELGIQRDDASDDAARAGQSPRDEPGDRDPQPQAPSQSLTRSEGRADAEELDLTAISLELGEDDDEQGNAISAPEPEAASTRGDRPDWAALEDADGLDVLWMPEGPVESAPAPDDLGQILVDRKIIAKDQLQSARTVLKQTPGKTLREVLIEMGADEEAIQRAVAELAGLPFERIDVNQGIDGTLLNRLGLDYCKANNVIPVRREGRFVVVGSTRPDDVFLLDEVRRKLNGAPIRHILVTASDVRLVVELNSEAEHQDNVAVDEILADIDEDDVEVVRKKDDDVDFEREAGESPVIRYVNYIIQTALKEGASDIHIEPGENKIKVRFRIDGVLFEMMNPPVKMHAAIISRLKIMANLDISERRLPQDGRIRAVVAGRKLDLRVSTLPTVAGEKCVMRILDNRSISVGLDQLGFEENTFTIWKHMIAQPHGIILVTGPTGSGKTTTLYASLREVDTQRLNVSTVEDPVEYHLDNISQVQIHDRIGMTFAAALRSLLRQDPDVVMVGEIRDVETARIAIQASLTGHLVLSTLHTNDAPSSVTRLINIGVEPFLIGAALNAVLAQRLVRRICEHCKEPIRPSEELGEFLAMSGHDPTVAYKGKGCDRCRHTGYSGRVGIHELLVIDDAARDAIAKNPNVTEFRRICVERGMVSLRQDGMHKVAQGLTTVEEILRVTESTI